MSGRTAKPTVRRDPDRPNELTIVCEFVEIEVDQDDLLAALDEAGVLKVARAWEDVDNGGLGQVRYVSPWKETTE